MIVFIYGVVIVFTLGLLFEAISVWGYWKQTKEEFQANKRGEQADLSIFNKGNLRSPLHFIPTLLTALGILGTFTGIFFGLQGINLQAINNTDALLEISTELLAGMKTAFQSSLWGLGGASLFILILAGSEIIKRRRRNHLLKKIRKASSDNGTTQALINQLGNVADKMESLATLNAQNIGEEVATALQPTFQEVRNDLNSQHQTIQELTSLKAENIGQEVATALKPTFGELQSDLNAQRQTIENQRQELVQTLVGELRTEVIEPVTTRVDESANATKEASVAVRELNQELSGVSESLANSIQTIQQFQERTLGELETFAQQLKQTLDQFQTDTQGVMENIATDIHNAVNESISGMEAQRTAFAKSAEQASNTFRGIREDLQQALTTQAQQQQKMLENVQTSTEGILQKANDAFAEQSNTLTRVGNEASDMMSHASENLHSSISNAVNESISGLEAQRNAFSESAQETAQTFQKIREDLQQALTTQAQQQQKMLENVQTSTEGILQKANDAFAEQSNTLTRVGNEASDMMSHASENLNGTLSNIDTMLQNTRQTVQKELENFRTNYQESLNQFFEQQNNLLEKTLGQQREGLQEVVKELQRVFQEDAEHMANQVTASMDKIQTTTESVSHLANTTGLTSAERLEQIQEIARTLGSESEKINQAYANLIQNFNQGLETWNQNLTQYFEQANETYEKGRQESEQAAAEVCNQLNETSQSLMGVAEYLVAAANDLNNAKSNR